MFVYTLYYIFMALNLVNWVESLVNGGSSKAGVALKGGIAKDKSYEPKEPFFNNGKSKNLPIFPKVPFKLEPHPKLPQDTSDAVRQKLEEVGYQNMQVPYIDTPDGKLAPSQILDQYLGGVEGGKQALLW